MTEPIVAFTIRAAPEVREAFAATLAGLADLRWLADLGEEEAGRAVGEARVLVSWSPARELPPERLAAAGNLQLLQVMSAGADSLPFDVLPPDLPIASNVGGYAEPMAEHVVAMILTLAKHLPRRRFELQRGEWRQQEPRSARIDGSVCAILGYGGIGRAVARRMRGFGARIHAVNTSGRTSDEVEFVGTLLDLDRVLAAADSVVVALPLTLRTRGLIGEAELARMKPDATIVNVARGAIIGEDALFARLSAEPTFGAGIDAWWDEPPRGEPFRPHHPFLDLPNVVGSPHSSAIVGGFDAEAAGHAARNVARFLRGEPVRGLVRREEYVE